MNRRRIVCGGRVAHLIRSHAKRLKGGVGVRLVCIKDIQVGDLNTMKTVLLVISAEQGADSQELGPLIRGCSDTHGLRKHLGQSCVTQEGATEDVPVEGDLELLLAVNRVEGGVGRRSCLTEHVLLQVITILVVNSRLDEVHVHLFNGVTEIHHTVLENGKRVAPGNIAHNRGPDPVNQR